MIHPVNPIPFPAARSARGLARCRLVLAIFALSMAGGCMHGPTLTVEERYFLDARHDHLRCEVYLDRLRDLYDVTDTEPDGIMDPDGLRAGSGEGEDEDDTGMTGSSDDPLTGGHDGPLTGGHDDPLTGGHDDPLTGGHDMIGAHLVWLNDAREACWDAVDRLVDKYNECVVDYLKCEMDCYDTYETCIEDARVE